VLHYVFRLRQAAKSAAEANHLAPPRRVCLVLPGALRKGTNMPADSLRARAR